MNEIWHTTGEPNYATRVRGLDVTNIFITQI